MRNYYDLKSSRRELEKNYERTVYEGKNWKIYLGDCCEEMKQIPDDSIQFSIFSPPFSNLYIYSDMLQDMGNCKNDDEFFAHFGFTVAELYRVIMPGRLCAVHCKDLVDYKSRDGEAGLRDIPGEIIRLFESKGFKYHSRVTIWKDPVIEMQRTKAQGLLHAPDDLIAKVKAAAVAKIRGTAPAANGTSQATTPRVVTHLSSAMIKQVKKKKRFVRVAPNTFGLRQT